MWKALLLWAVLSLPLWAATPVTLESPVTRVSLLELYTSEGCSSCPPADRWLSRLQDDPRLWQQLVPVAFHVDYWDYLGWSDRFAAAEYSQRQRRYARQGFVRTVYTPGLVLNGEEWRGWFSRPTLRLQDPAPEVGVLRVELSDGRADAVFTPKAAQPDTLELHLAVLGFGLTTPVGAGENRGRTLNHDFAVLGHRQVALTRRDGGYQAAVSLPEPRVSAPRYALAAWISRPDDPRPIQAVGGWLP